MVIAVEWYEAAGFWVTTAGVLLATTIGTISISATYRAAVPKRRLVYGVTTNIPMLRVSDQELDGEDIRVMIGDEVLKNPTFVEVRIANYGRRDIPSQLFDKGEPLQIHLKSVLVRPVGYVCNLPNVPTPTLTADERSVCIGPSLLAAGQIIVLRMMVDGAPNPTLSSPLIDTKIDEIHALRGKWRRLRFRILVSALLVGIVGSSANAVQLMRSIEDSVEELNASLLIVPATTAILLFCLILLARIVSRISDRLWLKFDIDSSSIISDYDEEDLFIPISEGSNSSVNRS
ncbi:hypothetical protein ACGFIK_03420 [Micromonospora sp. NPDC048871]|uniref:hypothetical protein n=1 Tax=unclassified Micromonospora TaxID=2617518 RepID=UPI002E161A41|nr:hypothetical protein OIE53_17245 [Micromonospora sp. NBC_01739]